MSTYKKLFSWATRKLVCFIIFYVQVCVRSERKSYNFKGFFTDNVITDSALIKRTVKMKCYFIKDVTFF